MSERIILPPASPEEIDEIRRQTGLKEGIVVSDYQTSHAKWNSRHIEPHDPPTDARGVEVPSHPVNDGLLRGVDRAYHDYHETEAIDPSILPDEHDPFKE